MLFIFLLYLHLLAAFLTTLRDYFITCSPFMENFDNVSLKHWLGRLRTSYLKWRYAPMIGSYAVFILCGSTGYISSLFSLFSPLHTDGAPGCTFDESTKINAWTTQYFVDLWNLPSFAAFSPLAAPCASV